jgi:hypothetical protein
VQQTRAFLGTEFVIRHLFTVEKCVHIAIMLSSATGCRSAHRLLDEIRRMHDFDSRCAAIVLVVRTSGKGAA